MKRGGVLAVGTCGHGDVVIQLPTDMPSEEDGTIIMHFSPQQARNFGQTLLDKAALAEQEIQPGVEHDGSADGARKDEGKDCRPGLRGRT